MAAYASVLSLLHTLQQIQNHPHVSNSFDAKHIQSLRDNLVFLQDFLENCSCRAHKEEGQDLERQIVDAAYAAEDLIESRVVDWILDKDNGSNNRYVIRMDFLFRLQKAMKAIDSIKSKFAVKMQDNVDDHGVRDRQAETSSSGAHTMATTKGKHTIVGLDDDLIQVLDRVTVQESARQVIPIVGMGGIGKTTLARAVYESHVIVQHFDIRIWITLGQECSLRDVLLQIPICKERQERHTSKIKAYLEKLEKGVGNVINVKIPTISQEMQENNYDKVFDGQLGEALYQERREKREEKVSDEKLGEALYQDLFGRRYFVVIDDMWSTEVWDKIQRYFPSDGMTTSGRIVVTTRLSYVASLLGATASHEMNFLDGDKSWKLFCENAFADEDCPDPEFENVGKMIVRKCNGLPLLIVVIGKLLAKSRRTLKHWQSVVHDLNSFLDSEDDEHCLNILSLSYFHLPMHLKPCFLYMGTFSDEREIRVSRLIRLWIDEGFLKKPDEGKSLEDAAEGYLKDLVDRNLILVDKWKLSGKIKTCYVHDLLKDLCSRVAQKEKFICVPKKAEFRKTSITNVA